MPDLASGASSGPVNTGLRVGLLADTSLQLTQLESVILEAESTVVCALLTRDQGVQTLPETDVWLVRADLDGSEGHALVERLDALSVPVIYDETEGFSSVDLGERARRFLRKVAALRDLHTDIDPSAQRAQHVWVLAASAGGPEAVFKFVSALPENLDGVALIYVQHIEESMVPALMRSLARNTCWAVRYCEQPHTLLERCIYLVSPSYQIELNELGSLHPQANPWPGPYRPSVDQVVAKVWRRYGKKSGVVVFSGMGNDGAATCRMIKNAGGTVWIQTPESCAVDSMPREVLNTECVSFKGDPDALARQFISHHDTRARA